MADVVTTEKVGPGTLTIGEGGTEQDISCRVSSIVLEPDKDEDDPIPVLCGNEVPGAIRYKWAMKATILQDWSPEGINKWSLQNAGTQLPFTFTPNSAAGFEVSGEVVIRPATIGGDVDTENTSEVEWSLPKRPAIGEPGTTAQAYRAGAQSDTGPAVTDPETEPEYSV